MEMQRALMLFVVVFALSSDAAWARSARPTAPNALININPPLKDVSSDKKFFGPPFPADYPDDKRPVVDPKILAKVKGPSQPYPALQSKKTFDMDYVKDENSDTGAWKAQFEYDSLRKKLRREEADERAASDRANKEGKDVDGAAQRAKDADKNAADAQKNADAARHEEGGAAVNEGGDAGVAPSADALEELKKKVKEAEANYEKEKKEFEECKRQLEASKKELEDLKAQQKSMEDKLAADTKLWLDNKTFKLNAKKARVAAASEKRAAKQKEVDAKVKAAEKIKADMHAALAKEKAEAEVAKKNLDKEKADLEQTKKELEAATSKLQKLRGYSPEKDLHKSGASAVGAFTCLAIAIGHLLP